MSPQVRMFCSLSLHAAVFVALVVSTAAEAQDTPRISAVRALNSGQEVRVDLLGVGRVQGRFVASTDTAIILARRGVVTEMGVRDVERLWVRHRATRRGALIGLGAGALIGAVYGLLISRVACEPIDGGDCAAPEVAVVTGLLGGAGGAVIGAGVGFAIPVWRLRFP